MNTKKTKGQKSRENIISVSMKLFSLQGFGRTSIQQIADRCEISQTTVLYHFRNKRKLFEEVLVSVIKNNRLVLDDMKSEEGSSFEKLENLLRANIKWSVSFPEQAQILLLLFNFAATDKNFKNLATETIDRGRDLVVNALHDIAKEKEIQSPLSVDDLARIIQQYVNSVMFQILVQEDQEELQIAFERSLRDFLFGLLFAKM